MTLNDRNSSIGVVASVLSIILWIAGHALIQHTGAHIDKMLPEGALFCGQAIVVIIALRKASVDSRSAFIFVAIAWGAAFAAFVVTAVSYVIISALVRG